MSGIENLFKDKAGVEALAKSISEEVDRDREYRIMEVCGTHTMSIARYGISSVLPANVKLVSGPGCPVCVTSQADIDNCIDVAGRDDVVITTFGDMLKVAASGGNTLSAMRADGADVRIIYSPLDTIEMAVNEPDKKFVFLAVGFETTTPMAAGLMKTARQKGLENISVISMCKTMPAAIDLLLSDEKCKIDGFLCPGNVSIITGTKMYQPIVDAGKAAVVCGFEPVDILSSVLMSVRQINSHAYSVVNNYGRVCTDEGNKRATALTYEIFEPCNAKWRGLGVLKNSGMKLKADYAGFDAHKLFKLNPDRREKPTACRCGDILKGYIAPDECRLFGRACTPEKAVGPCMVSSEGACAAYYKYRKYQTAG